MIKTWFYFKALWNLINFFTIYSSFVLYRYMFAITIAEEWHFVNFTNKSLGLHWLVCYSHHWRSILVEFTSSPSSLDAPWLLYLTLLLYCVFNFVFFSRRGAGRIMMWFLLLGFNWLILFYIHNRIEAQLKLISKMILTSSSYACLCLAACAIDTIPRLHLQTNTFLCSAFTSSLLERIEKREGVLNE